MREVRFAPIPELQEAGLRDCPQRSCSAVSPFALPQGAGARLLQAFLSLLIKAVGRPIDHAPAEVHRAFHRGAGFVFATRSSTDWRITCIW